MTTAHRVAMHLRGAYLSMHRRANAEFARFGVTADQFVLLSALAESGAVTQQDLVQRCSSDPNTIRSILVRLERLELVSREPHATDLRARSVALTDRGRTLQRELRDYNEAFQADLVALFEPEEMQAFLVSLDRIKQATSATRGRRPKQNRD